MSNPKSYRIQKLDKIPAWFEYGQIETRLVVELTDGPIYFEISDPQAMANAINNLWIVSLDKNQGCLRNDPARLAKTLSEALEVYEDERTLIPRNLLNKQLINFGLAV